MFAHGCSLPDDIKEDGTHPHVLIAEDEPLIRFVLSEYLSELGLRVFEAENASDAIGILEADPDIDVVFTDIRMPGDMNGLDLARWVRKHRPGLPVMITSGDLKAGDMPDAPLGETLFFRKPYDIEVVADRIRTAALARAH